MIGLPDALWPFVGEGVGVGRTVGIFTGSVGAALVLPAFSSSPIEPWADDMQSSPTIIMSAMQIILGKGLENS